MAEARVLKLGPDGFRKIGIIGSAPSSVRLAPWHDKTWSFWCCSPGVYGVAPFKRSDVWWEIHRWEPPIAGNPAAASNKPWFSPEYVQFLTEHEGPVYLAGPDAANDNPVPSLKNGWRFPFEDYIARYGQYFFTSSMAWMLAHAIDVLLSKRAARDVPEPGEAIGLWGVDMAAHSEYAFQRPGCQHFIGLARKLGIQIILPPESDLMQPPTLYGISEYNPRHSKLLARLGEMQGREAMLAGQIGQMNSELMHIRGVIDDLKYVFNTYIDDLDPNSDITSAISLAGVTVQRPEPQVAALETFALAPVKKEGESYDPFPPAPPVPRRRKPRARKK